MNLARPLRKLALPLLAALAALPVASHAEEKLIKAAVLSVGVPAGFDELAGPQDAVADVIYGGRKIAQTDVRFEPGRVTFLDLDALLALVPDIADRAAVRAALAGKLDTHADLVCDPVARASACTRLDPPVAGVVFDQSRFRIELFINPRVLKVRAVTDQAYLPRPDAGLSLVDQIAGTVAGGSGGDTTFAINNRAVLGLRDARIISTASYASQQGLIGDVLAAQLDKPGIRYTAGMFWAPDIDLIGRRKLIGAGIETQFDTRFDKDVIRGTPLVVSLSQRSRVDLLVSGRLVSSRTYEAGNQSIDTSTLADGAYDVVLHIQELSGASRDERRFFSKNSRIAPPGKFAWFVHGGVLANELDGSFISPTRELFVSAGIAKRLNAHVALDASVVGTDGKAIAEIGGYLILPFAQMRLAALGTTRGDAGALFQLNSAGTSALNYNVDLRRVYSHDNQPLVPTGKLGRTLSPDVAAGFINPFAAAGTFMQAIAAINYHLPTAQVGLSGFYRREKGRKVDYAVGPTLRWSFFRRGGMDLTFEANLSQSARGRSAFAGVRLQLFRARSAISATVGAQTSTSDGLGKRTSAVGSIAGSWQDEDVLGGDLTVSGSLDHTTDNDLAHARADLRGPLGTAAIDAVQQLRGGGRQFSLGGETTVIAGSKLFAVGAREQSDSVIAVQVKDVPAAARFEVLVNETPRGVVHGGETLPVSVIPYRQYHVRIRPVQGELVRFDSAARKVSVYPGNVVKLAWTARPVVAMFGRVLWPDGSPVADADIVGDDAVAHTDGNGYFQIEASPIAALTLRAPNGKSCRLALGGGKQQEGYMALGALTCRDERPFGKFQITSAQ